MKSITGINPDFADYDEIDADALEAVEEFRSGYLSFAELAAQIGPEAAKELRSLYFAQDEFESLFDDPDETGDLTE